MRELLVNMRWGLTGESQAMLIEDGRVVWRHRVEKGQSMPEADVVADAQGRYVLPGFIDAHCHVLPAGLDLQAVDLSTCATSDEVLDALRDRLSQVAPGRWLEAVQYDQNRFADGRHMTVQQLDSVSSVVPILISHVSGHAAVANTGALHAAKVFDDTPHPKGGEYVHDEDGKLTGVLLETACDKVSAAAPQPALEEMVQAILAAGERMAVVGITTAADMMTGSFDLGAELEAFRLAAERGARVRTRLYLGWSTVLGPRAKGKPAAGFGSPLCRVSGVKMFADGALSSRTAAIYGAYIGEEPTHDGHWSGSLIYSQERLEDMVAKAHDAGYTVAVHSLGDYATDRVLDAMAKVGDPSRHRLEHAMLLSDAQIERIRSMNIQLVMQPEFVMRLAPAYIRNLGMERASRINRLASVLQAGVRLAFSSDRPVVGGNPWDGIRTAENRPEGFDPSENLTRSEAVLAYTKGAAEAVGDRGKLGSLAPGEWADYQLYDEDPLAASDPRPASVHLARPG